MIGLTYKTKKALKEAVGKELRYVETSLHGPEFKKDGSFTGVGPCAYTNRRWYATVTMANGRIVAVK